jgi:hypothetical protein
MIPTFAAAFGSTPLYNEATGGTITTFSGGGKNYKRHTFTGSGSKTLTVIRSPKFSLCWFLVRVVAVQVVTSLVLVLVVQQAVEVVLLKAQ